jgi:Mn2+/Fe2+ NRAMP family transporter
MSSKTSEQPQNKNSHGSEVQAPPNSFGGILRQLGPGMVIAASIVGSGELIATTTTGAKAGFWLLWLIIIGCVIKVFAQVEFGRYAVVNGKTSMDGMNEVPGPAIRLNGRDGKPIRSSWLVLYWFAMWFAGIAQLGGIVGGVGQALSISVPLTESGAAWNEYVDLETRLRIAKTQQERSEALEAKSGDSAAALLALAKDIESLEAEIEELGGKPAESWDDKIWAGIIAGLTAVLLVIGRYTLIQSFSAMLVASFTIVTVANLILLQLQPDWAVSGAEIIQGLSFRLPQADTMTAVATALATFGIIGVGASEIVLYPYWCLEKGYARFAGPKEETDSWVARARGWMRIMQIDAWVSMVIYTFATVAFYLLGAAILFRANLIPASDEMIRTLSAMYEPVFGGNAQWLFLFGAFAVLYSTFFVANAGHARVFSDALRVIGLASDNEQAIDRRVMLLGGIFPILCFVLYVLYPKPVVLVLISGVMQAIMLPMLAFAAIFFRYRRSDSRIKISMIWDIMLWISGAGMLIAGAWALWSKMSPLFLTG